ncbi:MAG TPA: superoxide dismutase [Bacteroidales bacterium]|nr:superoxide dismutase [Bacteroidales bacterium]HPT02713.1 superoxide dismutase [Bacteroidales bacterium]
MKTQITFLSLSFLLCISASAQYNYGNQAGMLTTGDLKIYAQDAAGHQTGFRFPALPYTYNGLQPAIDSLTVAIHYNRHHRGYYENFVATIKGTPLETMPIGEIFAEISRQPVAVRNNAGGYYNHFLYWENMQITTGNMPSGDLEAAIIRKFGSVGAFREQFGNAAKAIFGSGWAWLILNKDKEPEITTTSNQDNPLMDIAPVQGIPLLALDVWEHAYYLSYQNRRADYVNAFWNHINWDEVERRFSEAMKK